MKYSATPLDQTSRGLPSYFPRGLNISGAAYAQTPLQFLSKTELSCELVYDSQIISQHILSMTDGSCEVVYDSQMSESTHFHESTHKNCVFFC
jgi:hypothetical protein